MTKKAKNITITSLLVFLMGCGTYNAIDERLHPQPAIQKEAEVDTWQRGNQLDVYLTVYVEHAELTMWYYYCLIDGKWKPQKEIDDVKVTDGKASNMRKEISCWSKFRIDVAAYNNWGKRSQKSDGMIWVLDIPSIIK